MTAIAEGLTLEETAVAELQAGFRGEILGRGDPSYDERRQIWIPVAVRSGGHSFPGLSVADDALQIDLTPMKGIRVDPEARTARVQAGTLLGELDRETQAFGLAVPSGIVTHTGVAGLTLGGGIGWIMRKHGLSVDQLNSVDVVTADGEFLKASREENEDLFWGLCGAGPNFGIATEFEFNCVPLGPTILAGPIFWPMEQSGEVLRFYRDWVAEAPDELMTIVIHRKAPPLPFVPDELHGKPVVMVIPCWAGDIEEGEKFVRPLKEFGSPVADVCVPKPYLTHQAMFDPAFVPGRWYYYKSCDVPELTDEIIDITVENSLQIQSPLTSYPIWQMGGAVARVGDDETAFGGRNAGFTYNIGGSTEASEGFDEEREWVRNFWSALEPWHTTVYVNVLGDEGEDRIRAAYGADKYDRLKTLKQKYDPDNFFRLNQNIPPS
jgi:FAD/FMN-containing dehydrogenase